VKPIDRQILRGAYQSFDHDRFRGVDLFIKSFCRVESETIPANQP
jgi:hypothetical protein